MKKWSQIGHTHKKALLTLNVAGLDIYGANDASRTHDLLITNQLLYQLSYIGTFGGCERSRTALDGFAGHCITDLLRSQDKQKSRDVRGFFKILERETRFELATPTLARLCSTTELFPRFNA